MRFASYLKIGGLLVLSSLLFVSCTSDYNWGWYTISPFLPRGQINLKFLLTGIIPTIQLTLVAYAISIGVGIIIAVMGTLKYKVTRIISNIWVTVFRAIPILVMLLWLYYGLPIITNTKISVFTASMLGMGLCESAFLAEVFRTGISNISKSQIESAYVMGANTFQVYIKIIFPQAFTKMLPTITNQLIYMIKISSLASIIGLNEITRKANELTVVEYRPLEIYTFLVVEYLVLIFMASMLEKYISKKLGPSHEE